MSRLKDGLSVKLSSFSAVVFSHTVVFFLLTRCCAGQHQLVGPSQPVVATVGEDVILPCHLEPAVDASDLTVEWSRAELNPRFVHVWRDGVELESKKHPSYRGRTSLSVNNLKFGNISLKLSKVTSADEGRFRCFIPTLGRESTVELVVGAASFILISLMRAEKESSGVDLLCKSEGWYPEPEVLWLDGEGNLLSAGPAETVRGPDDLYTVSSRVTVEKRHSNRFTCRVQQKDINQTREAHIHVPDDIFVVCCGSESHIIISLAVALLFCVAVFFIVWKWRQNKMTMKDFNQKETAFSEKLKEKEEEQKEMDHVITTLKNHEKELQNLRDKLKSQLEDVERESTENKKTLEATIVSFLPLLGKDEVKPTQLEKRRTGLEECLQRAEEQRKAAEDLIEIMITRNTQLRETIRQEDETHRKSETGQYEKTSQVSVL